jgi:hypothetical protein
MATYGGAVDLILTELNRSDTSITAVVEREILKAIEYYSPYKFWFNEGRVSFTASNTIYYAMESMSAYMMEIDQASVTVSGSVYELCLRSHAELQSEDMTGVTGYPTDYALFGNQVRLYPKPASGTTYQVDLDGTKRLATLSASTDTNEWTDEALNLIAARVEKNLSARKFKDYEAAQMYQVAEDQELVRLQERTVKQVATGKIQGDW